ncbi:hypothetical protein JHK82_050781 [Glycine max]|uniref:Uncharacterized protein n=1 Tax=Glycine soja TaxID=3848 RepID=A0A445FUI1_GLYSO|nr:hypothetical protein JHK86_050638 [Glycine max]KAG4924922.1 hypothetical protein JHK87_050462 [Glycine soja]KAG5092003.1 hypothetical protein JHK82_050781 [Glycine max]RZB52494.1 hypothetical protein D0Y65_048810 [Glycine soja]
MFVYMHVKDKVVTENELFEKMKVEAEKCLTQTERIANERLEFESEIYAKYPEEEDTVKTESFDEENDFERSDEDPQKDITSSSKEVMANKPSHSKRTRHK